MAVSEQEFLELQGLVIKLKDELSQTKALQDQLMQNGLSDLLTGHGFQRYTNNMRLGRGGIQIEAPSSLGVSGIWFVPELEPDPSTADVTKSYVTGSAQSTGASFLNINALDNDPSSAPTVRGTAYVETEGSADRAFAGLEVAVDGDLTAGGEWAKAELVRSYSSDAGRFQLYQALLGLHPGDGAGYTMGDPANAIEGDIWYNTTDNQFKFYEGSTIKTLGGGGMSVKVKEADETITTSTTLQNDDELLFAVAANEVWQFEGELLLNAPAAADFKMTFTGPSGAVGSFGALYYGDGTPTAADTDGGALGTSVSLIEVGAGKLLRFWGGIHNGANAGNLQLQWAQDTSSGSTTVRAGSYIKYQLANV